MSQVSKNIRYLRRLHNYTQEEFAEILGIKRSSLGAYEEGRAMPNFSTLMQLGKLFGLTIEQIVSTEVANIIREPKMIPVNPDAEDEDLLSQEVFDVFEKEKPTAQENSLDKLEDKISPKALEKEKISPEPQKVKRNDTSETEEKKYPTLEEGLFSVQNETETFFDINQGDIPLVQQSNLTNYLAYYTEKTFIEKLPKIQMSLLAKNQEYRAFEMDKSFPLEKSICIGSYLKNWYNVQTGETYLFLTQKQGLVYGKAENRLRSEGIIKLQGLGQVHKILLREIFEIWQFQLLISAGKIENW